MEDNNNNEDNTKTTPRSMTPEMLSLIVKLELFMAVALVVLLWTFNESFFQLPQDILLIVSAAIFVGGVTTSIMLTRIFEKRNNSK